MPCNMMDGVDWGHVASTEVGDVKRTVAKHEVALNDQADTLCILRELVLALAIGGPQPGTPEHDRLIKMVERLKARVEKHRAFDKSEGRDA